MSKKGRRQALPLPAHVELDTVDNPYDVGPAKIVALRATRDDPLWLMWRRRQLDDGGRIERGKARYEAGRAFQRLWHAAQVSPVQAMDPTKEPVDGGGNVVELMTERKLAAMRRLEQIQALLCERDDWRMVQWALIDGNSIRDYAHIFGWGTAKEVKEAGRQFRGILEALAREFGYA